jgi:hypothetical protein
LEIRFAQSSAFYGFLARSPRLHNGEMVSSRIPSHYPA